MRRISQAFTKLNCAPFGLVRISDPPAHRFRLQGFGVKTGGLARYADCLTSADSLAWSFEARRAAPMPGCSHANCANSLRYAAG
jgi:hypothetical protein